MDQRLWVFGGWRVSILWQVFHFILSLPPGLRGDLLKHLMFSFGHCPIAKSVMFCHISRHFIMWDISHLDQWIWLVLFNFPLFFFYPASASLWVFQLVSSVRSSSVFPGLPRVAKCQIFYTDQYSQTRFYPEKSATFSALQTYKTELMRFLVTNKWG